MRPPSGPNAREAARAASSGPRAFVRITAAISTRPPSARSPRTVARPIPLLPPMTSATLPSNRAGKLANGLSASIREISIYPIQLGAVVPHDLALGRIRQREFQKPLGGLGIICVGMGIIRREDDVPLP